MEPYLTSVAELAPPKVFVLAVGLRADPVRLLLAPDRSPRSRNIAAAAASSTHGHLFLFHCTLNLNLVEHN